MKYYLCPVCGYDKLDEPPMGFSLCSCCGTEFELDDDSIEGKSHEQLRALWRSNGMQWFSRTTLPPDNWDPIEQLMRAGFASDPYSISALNSETIGGELRIRITVFVREGMSAVAAAGC
jgi:hypothetical protein